MQCWPLNTGKCQFLQTGTIRLCWTPRYPPWQADWLVRTHTSKPWRRRDVTYLCSLCSVAHGDVASDKFTWSSDEAIDLYAMGLTVLTWCIRIVWAKVKVGLTRPLKAALPCRYPLMRASASEAILRFPQQFNLPRNLFLPTYVCDKSFVRCSKRTLVLFIISSGFYSFILCL